MIKTLYLRIVMIFLAAVIISLGVAFFLTSSLSQSHDATQMQTDLVKDGKLAIQLYKERAGKDVASALKGVSTLHGFQITVFSETGLVQTFSHEPNGHGPKVSPAVIEQVLSGEDYLPTPDAQNQHGPNMIVGLPFQINTTHYALFINPDLGPPRKDFSSFLYTALLIVLGVGSLLIVVASRYVVKPIVAMTRATQQLAKGDFSVQVHLNRRDELGTLAASFNQMADELRQIEQARQDFVSNVSHEIQSPLTSIRGFSKALQDDFISEADRKRYLQIIQAESERLSRLSENLLRLASLESEHYPFAPREYALDEQLRHVVIAHEPQWADKDIEIDLDLPATKITADKDQLSQVFTNLLSNAIKHTPQGGRVEIALKKKANHLTVRFTDNGVGIPEEDRPKIFERFYKVDKSRDRTEGGNGLGLAIVNKIIAIHHGTIDVESTVGTGTTFLVTLPLTPASEE
ncbi:MAG: sensor histidine kinase [Tumebacillaceae bacterium]